MRGQLNEVARPDFVGWGREIMNRKTTVALFLLLSMAREGNPQLLVSLLLALCSTHNNCISSIEYLPPGTPSSYYGATLG